VSLTTIFFDAGGTLVFPDNSRTLADLAERGFRPTQEQLHSAEREAKQQLDRVLAEHHSVDGRYWDIYYQRLLRDLGGPDDARLRARLAAKTRNGTNWVRVLPGTRELLERLHRRFRLGVISNSDGSIQALFQTLQLSHCFDCLIDSTVVGYEKPDPRIFQTALQSLGARPEESLYVGDVYGVDYLGASAVGMQAVLVDVAGVYRGTPYPRLDSLAEVEAWLPPPSA
jgi:putative hydrolase of the HAD superfamily